MARRDGATERRGLGGLLKRYQPSLAMELSVRLEPPSPHRHCALYAFSNARFAHALHTKHSKRGDHVNIASRLKTRLSFGEECLGKSASSPWLGAGRKGRKRHGVN